MTLQLDPGDDEAEQQARMGIERKFSRELAGAFDEQMNTLLPDDATDEVIRSAPMRVNSTSEPVREVLRRHLALGSDLGVSVAFDQLSNIGLGFDWTLAHTEASRYASRYSYDLIRGINSTTQSRMQQAVSDWFNERTTLPDLRRELEPLFGKRRAQLVAQTETTRAAAEGNIISYEESGVVEAMEWVTVNDERVCPTCGPLNGKRAPLRGTFAGGVSVPAHPGCRCFVRPVVDAKKPKEPKPEPPQWKPAMSRAEAETWATNSQYRDDVYHTTNGRNVRPIMNDGFNLESTKFGRLWGDGVYVATDEETTTMYRKWIGPGARSMKLKINAEKLIEYEVPQTTNNTAKEFWRIYSQATGATKQEYFAQYDRMKQAMIAQGESAAEPQVFSRLIRDAGFDGIHLKMPSVEGGYGGNQIIIFDPKKVTVIDE